MYKDELREHRLQQVQLTELNYLGSLVCPPSTLTVKVHMLWVLHIQNNELEMPIAQYIIPLLASLHNPF